MEKQKLEANLSLNSKRAAKALPRLCIKGMDDVTMRIRGMLLDWKEKEGKVVEVHFGFRRLRSNLRNIDVREYC